MADRGSVGRETNGCWASRKRLYAERERKETAFSLGAYREPGWRKGCRFRPNFTLSQPVSSNSRNVGGAAIRQPETSQAIPRH